MDPSSTISLPRGRYLKSQVLHTCSPGLVRAGFRPTFQPISQQPIRVRLRPACVICRARNDNNRLDDQHSRGGSYVDVAVSLDGTLAASALENSGTTLAEHWQNSGDDPSGEVRWRKAAQIAVIAAAAVVWFLTAKSQPLSPFMSLTAAASGMSKEGMRVTVRSAWAGLTAGCLHTLSGPDHLAALTPLTIGRSHVRASLLGALWGFGHSIGQLVLGLAVLILKERFEHFVPALTKYGSTTVGLTLLAIGAMGLRETFFEQPGEVQMAGVAPSGDVVAIPHQGHGHSHGPQSKADGEGFGAWTLATGIVYGLQPDALFVIIPALALPTRLAAAAYILMFVFGTVAAMGSYTAVIGATTRKISSTNSWLTTRLSGIASGAAIVLGMGVLLSSWGICLPFLPHLHAH